MWVGDVVAERYVVERPVGNGGMGAVFLASDRVSGESVAVKVIDLVIGDAAERFRREAQVLSTLSHPGIVRYIAHGDTSSGEPFLVMEWLEGENLADRLGRGALPPDAALGIVRGTAEALALAHAMGIVHRDIKPSNLFLVGGDFERLKLLDFGIARYPRSQALTGTGAILGTVGYMAPEQASGARDVDARADVFALGCVLYECLTGRPPFRADRAFAVLAKVLYDEPPRVSELVPELGETFDALVGGLLAKDPAQRPSDGAAVLALLDGLGKPPSSSSTLEPKASLTHAEQKSISVIVSEPRTDVGTCETLTPEQTERRLFPIRRLAQRFGAEVASLSNHAVLFVLAGRGTASDRAARAASCALALKQLDGEASIALATGRAETTGRLPVGAVIDRAVALLRTPVDHEGAVAIDHVTAGLLGSRFEVRHSAPGAWLLAERPDPGTPRLLLGKPSPCVGRDKELAILDAVLDECIKEPIARAVLVAGPPGIGKSRLRAEFLRSVSGARRVTVLSARADQTQAGSSFAIVRQLVAHAASLAEGDSPDEQRRKIRSRLSRYFAGEELERIHEFSCELVGIGQGSAPSPLLRACRDDTRIMSIWMRRSFEEWLEAECANQPVLIVIEDLHWGDDASITYLAQALRRLEERPLLLLAFARPEVHGAFPLMRSAVSLQEVGLAGLTRRSAEQLVRAVLGDVVPPDTVTRIVRQADGNAFYLEELIRAVAEGRADRIPDTIIAVAEARLDALSPEARRVLRAASIFGEVFSAEAVSALLGPAFPVETVSEWFRVLSERELLGPPPTEGFVNQRAHAFRHSLLREAAYATLTDGDRQNGHRLAAQWLLEAGEKDGLVIAEHFERGEQPTEALPFRLRAAEMALNAGNNALALSISEQALGVANGDLAGRFLEIQQTALAFRGDWAEAFETAERAMALLPAGSTPWFRSAGSRIVSAIYLGRPATVLDVLRAGASLPTPHPTGPYGLAMQMIIAALLHAGARTVVLPFADRLDASAAMMADLDPVFIGWRHTAHATMQLFLHDRIAPAITHCRNAFRSFDSAADFVGWWMARLYDGIAHVEAGSFDAARASLTQVAAQTESLLLPAVDFAKYYLARVDALSGVSASAETLLDAPPGIADGARGFLAEAHLKNGNLELAEREARVIEKSASCYARVTGLSVLGRIAVAQDRPAEALALLDAAIADQDRGSIVPFWRSTLLLARAEALRLSGELSAARAAIVDARDRVFRIAAEFETAELRESYLENLSVHRRTVELEASWR